MNEIYELHGALSALSVLDDLDAYLANREDVVDGDYGVPAPNEEMVLLRELRAARAAFSDLISAARAYRNNHATFKPTYDGDNAINQRRLDGALGEGR